MLVRMSLSIGLCTIATRTASTPRSGTRTGSPTPALASIGTVGDSYDDVMAESVIGLYKAECVRHEGPVRTVDDLELRTLTWVHWFDHARLHSSLGYVPPIEFEQAHYGQNTPVRQALPGQLALH